MDAYDIIILVVVVVLISFNLYWLYLYLWARKAIDRVEEAARQAEEKGSSEVDTTSEAEESSSK